MTQSGSGKVPGANTGNENGHWSKKGSLMLYSNGDKVIDPLAEPIGFQENVLRFFANDREFVGPTGRVFNVDSKGKIFGMGISYGTPPDLGIGKATSIIKGFKNFKVLNC